MTELLTAAQMRAIEQAAIERGEVTGLELMERAGRGVVEAVFEEWPELCTTSHRAVVLCGPGNNGGDGFVVARMLKEWGWAVEVFLYGDADKLPPDARVNYERWRALGDIVPLEDRDFDGWPNEEKRISLIVDALLGTGLTRPFLSFRHLSMALNTCSSRAKVIGTFPKVVAVDVPSGMCSDSGVWLGDDQPLDFANLANLSISFHAGKLGHFLGIGPSACGMIKTVSIGLEGNPRPQVGGCPALPPGETVRLIDSPTADLLKGGDHKYSHGHALILSGGPGRTGAARLAARGALRIGAGLVTIACPKQALAEVACQVTAIMCRVLDGPPGLREVLEDERLNALCLGPGLGLGADTQALVLAALGQGGVKPRPTVLDADALSRFERNPEVLFEALHDRVVLTPHAGEFKRLFPDIAEKLNAPAETGPAFSKLDAAREAAARAGCVVLFKGPDTVIADPSGRCSINSSAYERAAPWLATAGSGDVLAGFITGLLARGFAPMAAAETAAWLHTECALSFGPGLIAEDLPEELPKVFRDLLDADAH